MSHFIYGTGPVRAIFLHGWFGDANCFRPILKGVDPERVSFAFMDCRGYGGEKESDGPFDIETVASDAARLCDHLDWESFSVVGHSMGGKAALRLATHVPGRVQRICAIAPVWAGKAPIDQEALRFFRSAAMDVDVRRAIIHDTTGRRLSDYWSRNVAARSMEISGVSAFSSYLESWVFADFEVKASELLTETLVVVGGNDPAISEEHVRGTWLKHLKNSRLAVLGEAGHYPMDECPLILAEKIQSFLYS
jgi:pimeloyl-ACP methyl ester carboxylesterase